MQRLKTTLLGKRVRPLTELRKYVILTFSNCFLNYENWIETKFGQRWPNGCRTMHAQRSFTQVPIFGVL